MPFKIVRNDITQMDVDAIVNATNSDLLQGGGVSGAIFSAAGEKELQQACDRIGWCETGHAVITPGFNLKAKYVIHAVGPVWRGGKYGEPERLYNSFMNSLLLAKEHHCESIALPLISSGIYGYPKDEALRIATYAISEFLKDNEMDVTLTVYDKESFSQSAKLFFDIEKFIDDNYVDKHVDIYERRDRERIRRSFENDDFMPSFVGGIIGNIISREKFRELSAEEMVRYETVSDYIEEGFEERSGVPSGEPSGEPSGVPSGDLPQQSAPSAPVERNTRSIMTEIHSDFMMAAPHAGGLLNRETSEKSTTVNGLDKEKMLKQLEETFQERLLRLIDASGKKDPEIYKKANVDKKLFSKIRSKKDYSPSKYTAVAFAIALELNIDDTRDLLGKAGYTLTRSRVFDMIIEYFITNHIYNIFEINEALYYYDQKLLGA